MQVHRPVLCGNLIQLISFHFITRIYLTSSRLHGLNPNLSYFSFKTPSSWGHFIPSFLHSTWQCSKLQDFWRVFIEFLSQWIPEICFLGNLLNSNLTHSHSIKLTEILLAVAKKKKKKDFNEMVVRSLIASWIEALITSGGDNLLTKE